MTDRRNDIGIKVITGACMLVLGLFFNHVYMMGKDALALANTAYVSTVKQETQIVGINEKLNRIDKNVEKLVEKMEKKIG